MFLDPNDPRPPPPSPGTPGRAPGAKRDEDMLIALILFAIVAFMLAPLAGGTLWTAVAALIRGG